MSQTTIERALIKTIEEEGGRECQVDYRGKHHKIKFLLDGQWRQVQFSQSPGRCRKNLPTRIRVLRRDIRRMRDGQ